VSLIASCECSITCSVSVTMCLVSLTHVRWVYHACKVSYRVFGEFNRVFGEFNHASR
jgi:hypothetical protein